MKVLTKIILIVKTLIHLSLVDCTWSEWTIGECSQTCGEGVRGNVREMFPELYGGNPCEGEPFVTESCMIEECPGKMVY